MEIEKSITKKLTQHAKQSLLHANKIARTANTKQVKAEHLLYSVFLQRGSVGATILANMSLTKQNFESEIFKSKTTTSNKDVSTLPINPMLKRVITDAYASAADFGYPYVGTEHFVYALLDKPSPIIKRILARIDKSKNKKVPPFHNGNNASMSPEILAHIGQILGGDSLSFLKSEEESGTHALDQFTDDPIENEKRSPFIGYAKTIQRITTILGRRNKNNPLLVGNPGVGKTALIEHLAAIAQSPDAPPHIRGKKILTLDLALLVAGTSFRGEFEQRLKDVIAEAGESHNIILFIDEIHTIIGTGNTGGSLDAANILKPALARGDLHLIGATTHEEFKKHIAKDAALARRFQKVEIIEPTVDQAIKILMGARKVYEAHHGVSFSPESLKAAVKFSDRYITEQSLPDKAFDLIDETASHIHSAGQETDLYYALSEVQELISDLSIQKSQLLQTHQYEEASLIQKQESHAGKKYAEIKNNIAQYEKKIHHRVEKNDIAKTLSQMTSIPYDVIMQEPQSRITQAKKSLSKNIIGQDEVIDTLTTTLARSAIGIGNVNRPQGSFLFLGPTGVGKTLSAQILAREIYGSDDALIRVDMSELMERHASSKLLGAPAGYVGYGEGGTLTEKIRKRPYSVVLFDEIEKAHPDTFNLLLQILEDGTITDSEGNKADFRHAIIILTSNIGSQKGAMHALGFNDAKTDKDSKFENALSDLLPQELISRLDHILTFDPLSEKTLAKIAQTELSRIKKNLRSRNISLTIPVKISRHIAQAAVKEGGNARLVRKQIQDSVEKEIAHLILEKPHLTKISLSLQKQSSKKNSSETIVAK